MGFEIVKGFKVKENVEKKSIKVGIVEDDDKFLNHLKDRLNGYEPATVVNEWKSAEEYWQDPESKNLDVLLLDIRLPGMTGIELAGLLSLNNPEIRKIILTTVNSDEIIFQALRHGCLGYILKSELKDIGGILEIVMSGGAFITPTIAFRVLNNFKGQDKLEESETLTSREQQILEQMVSGHPVAKVAEIFDISINTVRNHVKNIYQKLNVKNRQEMMRKANQMGYF